MGPRLRGDDSGELCAENTKCAGSSLVDFVTYSAIYTRANALTASESPLPRDEQRFDQAPELIARTPVAVSALPVAAASARRPAWALPPSSAPAIRRRPGCRSFWTRARPVRMRDRSGPSRIGRRALSD